MTSAAKAGSLPRVTVPQVPAFDIRMQRDLLGRRVHRETLRVVTRIGVLLALDAAAAAAALAVVGAAGWEGWHEARPLVLVMILIGQAALGTYGPAPARRNLERVTVGVLGAGALLWLLGVLYPALPIDTGSLGGLVLLGVAFVGAGRWGMNWCLRRLHARDIATQRVLVVGGERDFQRAASHFDQESSQELRLLGYLSVGGREAGALGSVEVLGEMIERYDVSRVLFSANLPAKRFRSLVQECLLRGVAVSLVPGVLGGGTYRVSTRNVMGWPLLELQVPRLHLFQIYSKRVLDLVGSALLLVLLSPLFLVIAALVRLDSPGPVFFRQARPGLGGTPFRMLKFRTMRADAEEVLRRDPVLYQRFLDNDCKLPAEEDPRISRLGLFLRRTSLDELPQLINVLRGEMSLVGPRPIVGPELEKYGEWALVVLGVKPGMTGYWQVSGRSGVGFPDRAYLDGHYIVHWSLGLDLMILLRTIPAVLQKRGAF